MPHQENVDGRTKVNVPELGLAIVRNHIPDRCIDERKHRGAWARVRPHGNVHVRYVRVEGCDDPATFKIEAGLIDPRSSPRALRHQSVESIYVVDRLAEASCRFQGRGTSLHPAKDRLFMLSF